MLALLVWLTAAQTSEQATCAFDTAPPESCTVAFTVRTDGTTELRAKAIKGEHQAVFIGRRQSGWWAGTLDGAEAMGYELNRGNVTFATRALDRTFQYYTAGHEHGSY
ncbi:hypothetical protein LZK98_06015 [Sphingomonas cannabina]|uniref:hypothetical protein n=1 Tax=Sphingomonas cannabina TaxID=2899123 RepID=UPI001F3A5EC5|nr:hypothetical protein [Sphingomonas cannabina]UIJ46502.1 hypothetical protein LZK98_06015 [Sphingomonas cannabina]